MDEQDSEAVFKLNIFVGSGIGNGNGRTDVHHTGDFFKSVRASLRIRSSRGWDGEGARFYPHQGRHLRGPSNLWKLERTRKRLRCHETPTAEPITWRRAPDTTPREGRPEGRPRGKVSQGASGVYRGDTEILNVSKGTRGGVAGQTDPDNATAVSADITVTPYAPDGGEGNTPYVPVSFEVGGGTDDDVYDIEYSKHMENDVEFGDPANYEPANLVDADGNVIPPGLPQFPVVDGYETPGVTPSP